MTQVQDNRCFGRLKARELTEEETALVAGSHDDIYHHMYCARSMNGESGQECQAIGCFYT